MMNKLDFYIDDKGGAGTPVLFLHSLAGNTEQWQEQLRHLRAQNRRAIAFDFRGHGRSPLAEANDYSLATLAQDVVDVLERLDLEKVVLVGHSMGGAVASYVVGHYPERVAGLFLVDAAGDSTQIPEERLQGLLGALASEEYPAVIQAYWTQILQDGAEATQQQVMQDLAVTPKEVVVAVFNTLVRYNAVPDLARYPGPKFHLRTAHSDSPFSLYHLLPDLRSQLVTDVSHWPHLDKPELFQQALDKFLVKQV